MCDGESCGCRGAGLAALRMMVGVVFIAHGYQKLFVYGLAQVSGMFGHIGIPLANVAGPLVAFVELLGGLALFFGLGTRWVAILLAINMAVAVLAVHLKGGFFAQGGGFEYPLTLLVANVALALAGPGACAVDNLICKKKTEAPPVA
ncbi:MAG: DoxX family protein [Bryobacteraceae bacterium]